MLVADVLPFALQKGGDDESVDSRVVAACALGSLASRLEKETVESRFLARALAMCQVRSHPPRPKLLFQSLLRTFGLVSYQSIPSIGCRDPSSPPSSTALYPSPL